MMAAGEGWGGVPVQDEESPTWNRSYMALTQFGAQDLDLISRMIFM